MRCPNCRKENPEVDWCADADYGTYNLNEFEKGITLDIVTCSNCGESIDIKIKAVSIKKEKKAKLREAKNR